jgi:hypothetical protein
LTSATTLAVASEEFCDGVAVGVAVGFALALVFPWAHLWE